MLNSERWFNGHICYQVGVPNGFYTVILYFAENYPPGVSPALGGANFARSNPATKFATCSRIANVVSRK